MIENEQVQVVNVNNGERLVTTLLKGKRGSGVCCLNGPAARKGMVATWWLLFLMHRWRLKKQNL
jgi:aspartate 1-decarboxylase